MTHPEYYRFCAIGMLVSILLFLAWAKTWHAAGPTFALGSHYAVQKQEKQEQVCNWTFDRYESSSYEEEWLGLTEAGLNDEVCARVKEGRHAQKSYDIMTQILRLVNQMPADVSWSTTDTAHPEQPLRHNELFSRLYYKRVCYAYDTDDWSPAPGVGVQLIEPLFGMLRDPYDIWCPDPHKLDNIPPRYPNQHGQSKLHILPQGFAPYAYSIDGGLPSLWRSHGLPPWVVSLRPEKSNASILMQSPRSIALDFGASYFGGWTQDASAASGTWLYDHYHHRGRPFDAFIAVEVERLDPDIAFQQIPEDLMGKYTLMNVALSMKNDKFNAIDLIRRVARKEDFLVFKLDIDSAPIEMPIINELLNDDRDIGVSGIIDELMFEHHVNFAPMNEPWGLIGTDRQQVGDLASSYKVFRDLRRKGIRAHSWP